MVHLNRLEIQDLINRYASELKKLDYQAQKTKATIKELEEELGKKGVTSSIPTAAPTESAQEHEEVIVHVPPAKEEEAKPEKKRRGRPRKNPEAEATAPVKRGPGRPRKEKPKDELPKVIVDDKPKAKRKVRFNDTDVMLMDMLGAKGRILIASEIIEEALKLAGQEGEEITEEDMKIKVNRSLQKLSNRRDEIKKVSFNGRGFAYALPNWIDKKGTLKSEFLK